MESVLSRRAFRHRNTYSWPGNARATLHAALTTRRILLNFPRVFKALRKAGEGDHQQPANLHAPRKSNRRSGTSNVSLKLSNGARRGSGRRGARLGLAIIPLSRVNRMTLLKELVSGRCGGLRALQSSSAFREVRLLIPVATSASDQYATTISMEPPHRHITRRPSAEGDTAHEAHSAIRE